MVLKMLRNAKHFWDEARELKRNKEFITMQKEIFDLISNTNKKIIIFSSDCTGGRLMKDYKLPQYSPMVNIWYSAEDFLKICENPDKYLHGNIDEIYLSGLGKSDLVM